MKRFMAIAIVALLFSFSSAQELRAQTQEPLHAGIIPAADLLQPEALQQMIRSNQSPIIFQVGSYLFFTEAHIVGSRYAGPSSQQQGLNLLEKAVAQLPKDTLIVLYCGCCPWNRCPNVAPAWKQLHDDGYTNVKVLYLAHNFGDDWVAKGYPTER